MHWRALPEKSWFGSGRLLSGFGGGEGPYGLSYCFEQGQAAFLNGRVSARFRFTGLEVVKGAGVVCRADPRRTFMALYVVSDNADPTKYSLRLGAFKHGALKALVALKNSIDVESRAIALNLQFFSTEITGEMHIGKSVYSLEAAFPAVPFPGNCGVVRFYGSSVIATKLQIEELDMKPILPESEKQREAQAYNFTVFISHGSKDKAIVRKLTRRLKDAAISYWIDEEQITFGDPIVAKIEEGLRQSRFVVACLSRNLVESGWSRAEYGPILYREFSGKTSRRVIPVSLDGATGEESVPLLLSDKMRANLMDEESMTALTDFLSKSSG